MKDVGMTRLGLDLWFRWLSLGNAVPGLREAQDRALTTHSRAGHLWSTTALALLSKQTHMLTVEMNRFAETVQEIGRITSVEQVLAAQAKGVQTTIETTTANMREINEIVVRNGRGPLELCVDDSKPATHATATEPTSSGSIPLTKAAV
jgi:hypothetical protein